MDQIATAGLCCVCVCDVAVNCEPSQQAVIDTDAADDGDEMELSGQVVDDDGGRADSDDGQQRADNGTQLGVGSDNVGDEVVDDEGVVVVEKLNGDDSDDEQQQSESLDANTVNHSHDTPPTHADDEDDDEAIDNTADADADADDAAAVEDNNTSLVTDDKFYIHCDIVCCIQPVTTE